MKTDLPAFWHGAVDIEIKGRFSERFLNLAFQEGIDLRSVEHQGEKVFARVPLNDMSKLRTIAHNSRCSFHIRGRFGIPFIIAFLRSRPLLPIMAAVAIFLFVFISSFIFTLDVGGPYPVSDEDKAKVLALAAEAGIEEGHSRWGIDMDEVEKHILLGFDELVFAQVVQDGVHVQINVVRRVDVSPADQQKQPGHLVADFDGIIEDVLVRRGTAAVSSGDAVCKGDILIYGWQGEEALAADGIVTAKVWGEGYGECALHEEWTEPSGNEVIALGIRVNNGSFLHLAGAQESPYENYSVSEERESYLAWRKTWPSVEILIRKISELVTIENEYSAAEAQIIARERAEENAYANLFQLLGKEENAQLTIIDKRIEDIQLDGDPARAHVVLETQVEIGVYSPLGEEELYL